METSKGQLGETDVEILIDRIDDLAACWRAARQGMELLTDQIGAQVGAINELTAALNKPGDGGAGKMLADILAQLQESNRLIRTLAVKA
jgi:hypothetical protein